MTIKEIRAITGLSQRKFAKEYGLNKRTLQNWEGGANRPPKGFENLLLRAVMQDKEREALSEEKMMIAEQELYKPNAEPEQDPEPEPGPEPGPEEAKDTISRTENTNEKITDNKKLMSEIFKTVLEYLDDSDLCCTDCIYRNSPEKCNKAENCDIQLWRHYDDLIKVIRELTNTNKAVDYVKF